MLSIIIPVYNRPLEIEDLLSTLEAQTRRDFEVVIVEDGSKVRSEDVVRGFGKRLNVSYHEKKNGGPGPARNFGAGKAKGDFLIFLDSDTMLQPDYVEVVWTAVYKNGVRAFGGPDKSDGSFTPMQKAVSYSMTSFFTTGGIRGGKRKLDRFIPRSFNMGVEKSVFEAVGGFAPMRFGEDIDISLRIIEYGVCPVLLCDAAVFHKRRTSMESFFRQVYFSGIARINLLKRHRGSLKLVHTLPALFTMASMVCLICVGFHPLFVLPFFALMLMWFVDSTVRNKSVRVGWLSVLTSFVQLYGYGVGFIVGVWKRYVLSQSEDEATHTNFS